ncbi:MAG: hypothetical protein QM723_07815 [Myxococcaceae bacterium]
MAEQKKPPPPTPDITDPDLNPVQDPKRFDLDAEVTVHQPLSAPPPPKKRSGLAPAGASDSDDVTQAGTEPPKPPETMLGDSASDLRGPRGTFDGLSQESAVPSFSGLAATPASTALFDDEEEATEAIAESTAETPTPVKPKGNTGKQAPHRPVKKLDAASGVNRAHRPKHKPQPMNADAFEPVAGARELGGDTDNDLNPSFGFLSRLSDESLPVKLGLAAAIVSLTGFVFWLIFLAAR